MARGHDASVREDEVVWRVGAIGGDDASARQDQFVLRVADRTRARQGDDASVLEEKSRRRWLLVQVHIKTARLKMK